jgi:GNAT superfamily N-acetyltransferase
MFTLRPLERDDWREVAELIYLSTNFWYQQNGKPAVFNGDPADCEIFCATYEALDPGCCIVAVHTETQWIIGSCFYHPRPTHLSIGIVNTHPNYFGKGVARRLIEFVVRLSETEQKPLRLVSSAMNLDSFSLYTRAGFVPRIAFQDMYIAVPADGFSAPPPPLASSVRHATLDDVPQMAALERSLIGIERAKDYQHFVQNRDGIWGVSVQEEAGAITGFLASVAHPASTMLGPGVAQTEEGAAALLHHRLCHLPGKTPVFLVPVTCGELVQQCYRWGARNCEMHFLQVRGDFPTPTGILFPTFLPETG